MTSKIVSDPAIQHGKPVVAGTRIPVVRLIGSVAGGMTIQETAECYGVSNEDVKAALEFALHLVEEETFYSIPH